MSKPLNTRRENAQPMFCFSPLARSSHAKGQKKLNFGSVCDNLLKNLHAKIKEESALGIIGTCPIFDDMWIIGTPLLKLTLHCCGGSFTAVAQR